MKKILIILSIVLVVLIIFVTIITRGLFSGQTTGGQPTPTLFPLRGGSSGLSGSSLNDRLRSSNPGGFEEGTTMTREQINKLYPTLTQQQVQKEVDQFKRDARATLTTEQKNNLKKLQDKLKQPFKTDDFEIMYFPDLDIFVANIKRPEGYKRLEDYLKENNVFDVYQQGHGVIIVENIPDKSVEDLAKEFKEDMQNEIKNGDPHEDYIDTPPSQVIQEAPSSTNDYNSLKQSPTVSEIKKRSKDFVDLLNIFLSFNIGEPQYSPLEHSSATGETTTSTTNTPPTEFKGLIYPSNLGSPNSMGYYQMPTSPTGEYLFNGGTCTAQRWGSRTLTGIIYTTALNWKKMHPEARLRVGDLNASGRSIEHKNGIDVDLTEWANGRKGPAFNIARYNNTTMRSRSIELGKLLIDTKLIHHMWYNDATVRTALVSYARANRLPLSYIRYLRGHEDHVHVNISAPKGPRHEPSC